ncbi:hypothetical protein C8J48_3039 [Desmospora activa DSM 45169]|uniref:Uncharacterized protein n=1 Tax=Desmospora activa DSM 45169 TaxID=1121389 RepID=A0A2T4Z4A2_9BACL|nr:hypothetical protein C8J48_3039 [Desmospora activa DSM 45169]
MNYPVVGKSFLLGIFNATWMSIPLWFLLYLTLRLVF